MGHIRNYVIADAIKRFKKQQGYKTLFPMGWDSFGLPAENAAIKNNTSPHQWTTQNIQRMKSQMEKANFDINWENEIKTSDFNYYYWTQFIFSEMIKRGVAYQKISTVNYDPIEKTVLANEQIDQKGYGKRSGAKIEYPQMKQWFINISKYAPEMIADIEKSGQPNKVKSMQINWLKNIKDWCVSRQRYWGTPMPIVYCDHCGVQTIAEGVQFPESHNNSWSDYGEIMKDWEHKGECPSCKSNAKRSIETLDTFFDSSFYFYRYIDPYNNDSIANNQKLSEWFPMNVYIGGVEHATAHLVFARFMARFLQEIGYSIPKEPFQEVICQGMVLGKDENGNWSKMSKSKGNSQSTPIEFFNKYGVNTIRAFILFKSPIDQDIKWDTSDIKGIQRFINKINKIEFSNSQVYDFDLEEKIKRYYKEWKSLMNQYKFNVAISKIMSFSKEIQSHSDSHSKDKAIRIMRQMIKPIIGEFN